jgi:hypothetical protein
MDFIAGEFMAGAIYFPPVQSLFKQCIFECLLQIFYSENQAYNEDNFKPKQRFYYSKLT